MGAIIFSNGTLLLFILPALGEYEASHYTEPVEICKKKAIGS